MSIDTPATIAVIGAGPIGLEAALYARFLGYSVDIYDCGRVAENLLRWGHVRLFSPFGLNRSPLGLAALRAHDDGYRPPGDDELLTGREFAQRYLIPLSQTDLLIDSLHEKVEVLAIGREGPLKVDLVGDEDRIDFPFRLLLRTAAGSERIATADVVIDASGNYGRHNWLGVGGIPALGECDAEPHIEYGLPDVLGREREAYSGRQTLVAGAGFSAATTVVALAELARSAEGTRVTWITRSELEETASGPIALVAADRLPERHRLAVEANRLARGASPAVTHWPATSVDAVRSKALQCLEQHQGTEVPYYERDTNRFVVRLIGRHAGEIEVDCIVANVGYRPDNRIYSELQVHECYASGGPMRLAAALAGSATKDCLDQRAYGPQTLINPEPDFYILGAKSYGRNSQFLLSVGLEQIRELFTIIGDRADLNLYRSIETIL